MVLNRLADGILARADAAQSAVQEAFFEPVIRLGVTGPSRAGKTVFITTLVHNLMNRSRMPALLAQSQGRIEAAFLQPQPDDLIPRFDYETHLSNLTGQEPKWSSGTDRVSELRLSLRVAPSGLLGPMRTARRIHLDIVDYPGEWLHDLGLLDQDYSTWSASVVERLRTRPEAEGYLALLDQINASDPFDESLAQQLAQTFTQYLQAARGAGYYDITPGRFLLPGDLEGSPVLTFAPLPLEGRSARATMGHELGRRFEAYKSKVIKPFFRNHFARLDRQVVLVDPLTALAQGPQALADLETGMAATLRAFRPGKNRFLQSLFQGRRIDRILFAATKADALHNSQHTNLTALTQSLLRGASDRAEFQGAQTKAMSIAALRTTSEDMKDGLGMVVGRVEGKDRPIASFPGLLPAAPGDLMAAARSGATQWDGPGFNAPRFLPRKTSLTPGTSLPHIRLDHVAQFLIGDKL